jgi:hypothetical protein
MINMAAVEEEALHLLHRIHTFLFFQVILDSNMGIKMNGKMKMSFLTLEKDRSMIWNLFRGNLALQNHLQNGKRVFLFISVEKAFVRFEAELELLNIDYFRGPDRKGTERNAIKFFFKRAGKQLEYSVEDFDLSLAAEPDADYNKDKPNVTERQGLVTSRVGQGAYRKSILFRWEFKCAVTDYSKKES